MSDEQHQTDEIIPSPAIDITVLRKWHDELLSVLKNLQDAKNMIENIDSSDAMMVFKVKRWLTLIETESLASDKFLKFSAQLPKDV